MFWICPGISFQLDMVWNTSTGKHPGRLNAKRRHLCPLHLNLLLAVEKPAVPPRSPVQRPPLCWAHSLNLNLDLSVTSQSSWLLNVKSVNRFKTKNEHLVNETKPHTELPSYVTHTCACCSNPSASCKVMIFVIIILLFSGVRFLFIINVSFKCCCNPLILFFT